MSQNIREFVSASCGLLAIGEPTHREPAFGSVRNEIFSQLVDQGFRSIAIETDRVAALMVNDYVQEGVGTLDAVMSEGFTHGFGELDPNRKLVSWMREYNRSCPVGKRLAFHGFDAPTEITSAPSPRRYLEYASHYLELDVDIASVAGEDEKWSSTAAAMDPAMSIGDTANAETLRVVADDMLTMLYSRAPERISATSRGDWLSAKTYLTAGLGLLRYHKQSALRLEQAARVSRLSATRDVLMAQNLLDIRDIEARRGGTLVFAHNLHLRRDRSSWSFMDMDIEWCGAGAIIGSLLDDRYAFIAGSLGRSEALGLSVPAEDSYEGLLESRIDNWGLTTDAVDDSAHRRTDAAQAQGYFPLDRAVVDAADAVLCIRDGTRITGH